MAQTSKINDGAAWSALEKSLDVLGGSKELVLSHLSGAGIDLSSMEEIERALTHLLGEGAQIILAPAKEQLKK